MALRYTYNPQTCRYEPIVTTPRQLWRKLVRFLGVSLLLGTGGLVYFNFHYPQWDETLLNRENVWMKTRWAVLMKAVERTSQELAELEQSDDTHYRVILDLEPLAPSIREAGVGGQLRESGEIRYAYIRQGYEKVENIHNRLDIEQQSLEKLTRELMRKEQMWASRPSIQPINNRQLTRFNSIFGMRLHPVYNDWRLHNGLDLTAPQGTPVYASGDGLVTYAAWNGGYGNVIFLNHGHGFETRYGHLHRFNVANGQQVKRGDLIGFVGNTGVSTTPHLHYEVLYRGKYVNPANFMFRDLAQEEYNQIIRKSTQLKTENLARPRGNDDAVPKSDRGGLEQISHFPAQ